MTTVIAEIAVDSCLLMLANSISPWATPLRAAGAGSSRNHIGLFSTRASAQASRVKKDWEVPWTDHQYIEIEVMIILGVNAYHADAAACIVLDGTLVAAAEEER